jgi:hypothetical protein
VESSYVLLVLEGRFGRAEIELGLRRDKSSPLPRVAELSPHRMLAGMSHGDNKNVSWFKPSLYTEYFSSMTSLILTQ